MKKILPQKILLIVLFTFLLFQNLYAQDTDDDIDKSRVILTGKDVPPWLVGNFSCSGTLISDRVIVTAAHCYADMDGERMGKYQRRTGESREGTVYIHPKYKGHNLYDAAIIILDEPYTKATPIPILSILDEEKLMSTFSDESRRYEGPPYTVYGNAKDDFRYAASRTKFMWIDLKARLRNRTFGNLVKMSWHTYDLKHTKPIISYDEAFNDNVFGSGNRGGLYGYLVGDLGYDYQQIDEKLLSTYGIHPTGEDGFMCSDCAMIRSGDSGGTIALEKNGQEYFGGIISGRIISIRAKSIWKWVYSELVKHSKQDAYYIAKQLIGNQWGHNDRKGKIGDVYIQKNNEELLFFRLKKLGSDKRYWHFPTKKGDNFFWKYLGSDKLPEVFSIDNYAKWGDKEKKIGSIYVYNNIFTGEMDFFRLKKLYPNGKYKEFPTNKTDSDWWEYLSSNELPKSNSVFKNTLDNSKATLAIYPNPSSSALGYVKLDYPFMPGHQYQIHIHKYYPNSSLVKAVPITYEDSTLRFDSFERGIYIIKLYNAQQKLLDTAKMFIKD